MVRLWKAPDIVAHEPWHRPVPERQRVWLERREARAAVKARLRVDSGPDIVLREPEQLSVLHADGGTFTCVATLLEDAPGDLVAAVDLDGDGYDEIVYEDDDELWVLQTSQAQE